jgi:hypothetical protein
MQYYAMISGQRLGPLCEEDLRKRIQSGEVDGQTPLWHEGLEKWQPCSGVLKDVPQPEVWFAMVGDQRLGPLHRGALERAVALGQVTADTKVWKTGMPKWRSWGKIAVEQGMAVPVIDPTNLEGHLHAALAANSGGGGVPFDFDMGKGKSAPAKPGKSAAGKGVFTSLIGRILPARKED